MMGTAWALGGRRKDGLAARGWLCAPWLAHHHLELGGLDIANEGTWPPGTGRHTGPCMYKRVACRGRAGVPTAPAPQIARRIARCSLGHKRPCGGSCGALAVGSFDFRYGRQQLVNRGSRQPFPDTAGTPQSIPGRPRDTLGTAQPRRCAAIIAQSHSSTSLSPPSPLNMLLAQTRMWTIRSVRSGMRQAASRMIAHAQGKPAQQSAQQTARPSAASDHSAMRHADPVLLTQPVRGRRGAATRFWSPSTCAAVHVRLVQEGGLATVH